MTVSTNENSTLHLPPMLSAKDLTLRFGGVVALSEVSLEVGADELVALIGPNGAGKSSLLNVLSGFYRPNAGAVYFDGADVGKLPVHRVAKTGLCRTFQGTHLLPRMSVLDNVLVGRFMHMRVGLAGAFAYFPWAHREELAHRLVAEEILDFLELDHLRHQPVGTLGYGMRKRVDLGRALAMQPRMLLLDEPMAGMNTEEKEDLARFILDIRESRHIPVVLVEHDMGVVMDIADRVVVLNFGRKIADATPLEVQSDETVIAAYLGVR
jgi:branched-chain amino acid transport system ATP-binding protein